MSELSEWLEDNKNRWTHQLTRVYDEVIAPDLEREWKKRNERHEKELKLKNEEHERELKLKDEEHEKELKLKDEERQILLAHVNNEIIATARVREENARFKKLLQKQDNKAMSSTEQLEASTPDATVSVTEYRHITEKFDDLTKRYESDTQKMKYLEQKNAYLERKNIAVMQKNKDMKESVRAWQEYCDRNIDKQKIKREAKAAHDHSGDKTRALAAIEGYDARPNFPSSPPRSSAAKTPQPLVGQSRSSPAPMLPLTHAAYPPVTSKSTKPDAEMIEQQQADAALERAEQKSSPLPEERTPTNATFLGHPSSERLTSSQTTEDEVAERSNAITQAAAEDEDDMPQFVSERSLKRKRKPSVGLRVYTDRSDGTPAKPIRVKEELNSSPPARTATFQSYQKDTMDLDELGSNVIRTPRRTLRRQRSIHSNVTGTLSIQRSNSAPFGEHSTGSDPLDEETDIHTPALAAVRDMEIADARAVSEPGDSAWVPADVLQPLDPNVESAPNKRMKKEEIRQRDKHNYLMESGETPPLDMESMRPPPSVVRARYNQRFKARKEEADQTPKKPALSTSTPKTAPSKLRTAQVPTPPSTTAKQRQTHQTPSVRAPNPHNNNSRTDPIPDRRPIWTLAPASKYSSSRSKKLAAAPPKKHTPLRSKPLEDLGIQDFKPNPAYNQGYTHAFSETIRARSDRLCLPGCTNPTCCGSTFRALASAALPLSSSQEDTLLQDYLGDAYDSFGLTQMSGDERAEVVLQARTRQMAKQHGKHRQAFERARSPPGFWRTGFPSTQEVERYREEGRERGREVVKERWLEAMRKGGRWVFKDE